MQGTITAVVAFGLLDVRVAGPRAASSLLAVANALLGMSLGLFLSAFAKTEFQAVQFMPLVIIPQLLLAGLLVPRDDMPRVLRYISDALPFTYAYEALAKIARDDLDARLVRDVVIVLDAWSRRSRSVRRRCDGERRNGYSAKTSQPRYIRLSTASVTNCVACTESANV